MCLIHIIGINLVYTAYKMVPLFTPVWSWDWADWETFPRSQVKDAAEPGIEPSYPKMQPREFHNQPSYAVSTLLSSTSFSPNNYSSWQIVDVCFEQHWARTGYRNIRSSYWLGSNWGRKRTFLFLQTVYRVCTLSLFSLYYSANNQLHHYKEETADLL